MVLQADGRQDCQEQLDRVIAEKDAVIQDLLEAKAELANLTQELQASNESLKKLAQTDELTGLNNRYYFDRRIDEEIERADRYATPLMLLLIDLDHFKQVNDVWGHDTGDQVLVKIAEIIRQQIRKPDILARWGGEEFVLLAPQTALHGGKILAEKLRAAIGAGHYGEVGQVTASIGLAEHLGGESYGSWFRRADQALYQAKHLGRNRVVSYTHDERMPVARVHLEWKSVWDCGNQVIDTQHRQLTALANDLIDQSLQISDTDKLTQSLNILTEQITRHFADEEKILEQIRYPDAAQHASRHRSLVRKMQRLNSGMQRSEPKPSAFFAFIMDEMLVGHLLTEDVLYFPYIRIQGGGAHGSQKPD
ncbi:MAG TPA: hypothetical protein DD640_03085 [Clostridiales bacterium]|nr:hypothetical protein [Clostridiales bacterium]